MASVGYWMMLIELELARRFAQLVEIERMWAVVD